MGLLSPACRAASFAPAEGRDYWSWSLPVGSIPDGPHTISVRGVDVNGVTGTVGVGDSSAGVGVTR